MVLALTQIFNSTGDVYGWISASTTNMTGSWFLSIIVLLGILFLGMLLFHMPELLVALIILPLLIVLLTVGELGFGIRLIVGVVALVIGIGLYAFYPSK